MPSFDVVCRVDLQEVDNAVNQTLREVGQRFDFKNTPTELRREENALHLRSSDEFKLRALADILRERLARRQVPLRALTSGPIEPGPVGSAKQRIELQQGIPGEKAREIVKLVKDSKVKVQVAIQGDQVRVTGKKRDDLQMLMKSLRERDFGIALQFTNFRD
jgi:cyclic-di-GMP-binding protein